MRVEFTQAIEEHCRGDSKSVFITGDLGYNAFEGLQEKLGDRFINAGVAEQNMVGLSAGLASTGLSPWVYSIAPFGTLRCYEQIRNDVCFHNLPVKIVGNGGGYTYGIMGSTHHALEDLGALKLLPNMNLFFPSVPSQVAYAVEEMVNLQAPSYLRLSRSPFVPKSLAPVEINSKTQSAWFCKSASPRATIVCVGHSVQPVLCALELAGQDVDVFSVSKFPFDWQADRFIVESIQKSRSLLLVDEHYRSGSIAESLSSDLSQYCDRFEILTPTRPTSGRKKLAGGHAFLLKQEGLDPEQLSGRLSEFLK